MSERSQRKGQGRRKKDPEIEHKEKSVGARFNDQVEGCYYELMKSGDLAIARVDFQQQVKFRVENCPTYGVKLKRGDRLLLFIDRQTIYNHGKFLVATHARFIETKQMDTSEVKLYLDNVLACSPNEASSTKMLTIIEQCPAPWRFILDSENLDQTVVLQVLNLSNAVVHSDMRSYPEKYQKFFQEFIGRAFICGPLSALLKNALKGNCHTTVSPLEEPQLQVTADQLVKDCMLLAESIARYAPKVIPTVIPVLDMLVDSKTVACEPSFVLSLLKSAVGQDYDPASAHWRRLPLQVTLPELQRVGKATEKGTGKSEIGAINLSAFLPSVRVQGAYTSEDSYMDTYTRLLREDRLSALRNAIAALRRGATDSEALRNVPILPDMKLTGIQMLHSSPCLASVVQTGTTRNSKERISYHRLERKLMHGSLVAFIVDGNFDDVLYATVEAKFDLSKSAKFAVTFVPNPNNAMNQVDGALRLLYAQDVFALVNPAYYKAFKPVMDALQRRCPKSFPFKEEIVFCNSKYPANSQCGPSSANLESESYRKNTLQLNHANSSDSVSATSAGNMVIKDQDEAVINLLADDVKDSNDTEMSDFEIDLAAMSSNSSSVFSESNCTEYVEMSSLSESETEVGTVNYCSKLFPHMHTTDPGQWFNPIQSCLFKPSHKYRDCRLPAYLKDGESKIDWNCIFEASMIMNNCTDSNSAKKFDFDTLRTDYDSLLDHSQLDAIELALHNRVAVIQGPPGTGKTFIGFKLAQLLLSVSTRPPGPILVVSYKNHILNEFLTGCKKFCKQTEVVRIGGQKDKLNTGVTHFKDMCPRPQFVPSIPDEFKGFQRMLHIVPLIVEFMPLREIRRMVLLADHGACEVLKNVQGDEQREHLMHIVNNSPDVYQSDISLNDIVDSDNIDPEFADVVRSIHNMLTIWFEKTSLEDSLIDHGVLLEHQESQLPSATSWSSKLKMLSTWEYLDEDEDNDTELLEPEHEFERIGPVPESKFVISLPSSLHHSDSKVPVYAVDAVRIKQTSMTEEELKHLVSQVSIHKHMKQQEIAHMVQILVQLKWKTSIAALRQRSRELSSAFAHAEDKHICTSAKELKTKAKVVGMTTDGAAIHQELLHQLQPAIVIIEEAAEILEPQVLAVVSPSVQHLIMIGDHKQLRPPVETHELRIKNKFDVSMIERLINNNHPHVYLTHQGRMLSSFVPLLEPIYDNLQTNRDAVINNKPTECLTKSMFFWSHNSPEEQQGTSYVNKIEGQMIVDTVLWCILQSEGYQIHPSKITIIAMYAAQAQYVRDLLKAFQNKHNDLVCSLMDSGHDKRKHSRRVNKGSEIRRPFIKVCTVDRYQGDENDFVFVSLVRSNDSGKLGHVKVQNRMCVSCSRARSGLYLFGNAECLRKAATSHWNHVLKYFKECDALVESVPLQCPRHLSIPILVRQPSKFTVGYDTDRKTLLVLPKLCKKPCGQLMSCGKHECLEECHPHLGNEQCKVEVTVTLSCGHLYRSCPCSNSLSPHLWNNFKCNEPCKRAINCPRQHPCSNKCGDQCLTSSDCTQCQKIELEQREREAKRKQALHKKLKEDLIREAEQLEEQEKVCSVTLLEASDDEDTQIKLNTVKQIISSCDISSNSGSPPRLELIDCFEITNGEQVCKFVKAKKEMLQLPRKTSFKYPHMALVVPNECVDIDQFIKNVAEHGVMPSDTQFGNGIFLSYNPESCCILKGPGPYKWSTASTAPSLVTVIICQVALGKRKNKQMSTEQLSLVDHVPPVREWGYWQEMKNCKSDSRANKGNVVQVVAPDQVLPVYLARCQRISLKEPLEVVAQRTGRTMSKLLNNSHRTISSDSEVQQHYSIVEAAFLRPLIENRVEPNGYWTSLKPPKVLQVEYIVNPKLLQAYKETKKNFKKSGKPTCQRFGFHGAQSHAMDKIFEEGFKIGGKDLDVPVQNGSRFGLGVYLATTPRISDCYNRNNG
jgi:hypothetical protein